MIPGGLRPLLLGLVGAAAPVSRRGEYQTHLLPMVLTGGFAASLEAARAEITAGGALHFVLDAGVSIRASAGPGHALFVEAPVT